MEREAYYKYYILSNIPRILTQVDRDADSKTYGSCDRNYWHLKIRDFSSAILQQTCLTLALAYKVNFAENIYYQNDNVRQWSIAALKYLKKIQLRDGSFNEYYPNEHSFPATAFILFAGCRTYTELELDDPEIISVLKKCAYWLAKHKETKAYNQEWASIAGIYEYSIIANDTNILTLLDAKIAEALKAQSADGWFPEQGGADIGYSSVALDMLSEYYDISKDERVKEPLLKLVDFLQFFVHPDGTTGGEYGSRNTIYFMPNGMESVAQLHCKESAVAAGVIDMLYDQEKSLCGRCFMDSVDERYLCHYVMHSYLRAIKKCASSVPIARLPCVTDHEKRFQDAGLMSKCENNCYFIVSARKGGLLKIYLDGIEWKINCGYRIKIADGKVAATNWLDQSYNIEWKDNGCTISGNFNVVAQKVQTPFYHFMLRVMALFLGDKVNKTVKNMTIFSDKHLSVTFQREILWHDNLIEITDKIISPSRILVEEASNYSLRLVASGKFFSRSDLLSTESREHEVCGEVYIKKQYDLENHKVLRTSEV